jgi:hypothetical protein
MVFTGEAAWRWRMLAPSSDRAYDTFWRQAIRWLALAAGDPIAIRAPAGASPGETLTLRVAVRNAAFAPRPDALVDVTVTAPDGRIEHAGAVASRTDEREDDDAIRYIARFRPEQPGVYTVSAAAHRGNVALGVASASVLVGGSDLEMMDPRLNLRVLQRIAASSGGKMIEPGQVAALAGALGAAVPAARLAVTHDLWHNGWSFAVIVLLLGAEWILRRRWGLR